MCYAIHYEGIGGTESINRDGWHTDNEGFVTAFDKAELGNSRETIAIPTHRIVKIEG